MPDDSYHICYLTTRLTKIKMNNILQMFLDNGFELQEKEKIDSLAEDDHPLVTLQYDNRLEVTLGFNLKKEAKWNEPKVITTFSTMPLETTVSVSPEEYTRDRVQERVEKILEVTRKTVHIVKPEYVWGALMVGPNPYQGLQPSERPISENIQRVPWILALSESVIEDLGGRDHVLETPAWRVEPLSTGHIIIVKTNNPTDPTEKPPVEAVENHLLE